jgi:polyhydroxyalkanoate synthesis regulator phasin
MPQPKKQSGTTGAKRHAGSAGGRATATSSPAKVVELLASGVLLTRERLQEAMDDAVRRGRMTRDDANEIVLSLLSLGRKQTEELRSDVEQLIGRAAGAVPTERALREVDRARRVAGIGRFPVAGYDDLTAAQVVERVADLTPAELRKVRDHERRNANRKSVLDAIERKLP